MFSRHDVQICAPLYLHETQKGGGTTLLFPENSIYWESGSAQTVQTQVCLLLKEDSEQDLHCLPFRCIIELKKTNCEPSKRQSRLQQTKFINIFALFFRENKT